MQFSVINILVVVYTFASIILSNKESGKDDDIKQLWHECNLEELISFDVFNIAIKGLRQIEDLKNKNIITIIDYSKPSTVKRFYVVDIFAKKLYFNCYVAHGRNSGNNYANSFSNEQKSMKSSLGFYKTAETYSGKNGYSMKLDGLEKGINDSARKREIVLHGAEYVSEQFIQDNGRLGRSWGCPALPVEIVKDIIDKISNGSCLFIYGVDDYYIENSAFIKFI